MAQWKLARKVGECNTLPPNFAEWVDTLVKPGLPQWLGDEVHMYNHFEASQYDHSLTECIQDSPHYKTCQGWCYTWPQRKFISRLRDEAITTLNTCAESGENPDKFLRELARTLKFGSAVIMQSHNSSQPKLHFASGWRVIYQQFFEMVRGDFFLSRSMEFQ
jgi:hypothetical protein